MNYSNSFFVALISRYLSLFLISINGLFIIYYFMSPITYFLSLFMLGLVGSTQGFFLEKLIVFNGLTIGLVDACVAGAAYYLLLALCLTTPMILHKRVKAVVFSLSLFLIINVIRITIFSLIAVSEGGSNYFDTLHLFSWYFLSIIIVLGVWFTTTKVFVISGIPVYDDFKFLLRYLKK
ncbi:MAG: pacearchaeosortase [Nanoarchaeota archaeon]